MKPHSSAKPLSSMVLNFERASEVHLLTKVLLCLPSTLSFALVSSCFFFFFSSYCLSSSHLSWPLLPVA